MEIKTLVVCSLTEWIAQDFLDASLPEEWRVIKDRGFDLPSVEPSIHTAWWMPTEHAVKLRRSGLSVPFMAPGPKWMDTVPQSLTGRYTASITIGGISENPSIFDAGKLWIKPAEFKHQQFFAGLYSYEEVRAFSLPDEAVLQWTDTVMDFSEEYRFFICEGEIIASSVYLAGNVTYYDGAVASLELEAGEFAEYAVSVLGDNQPPAYVLDIGFDRKQERWVIIEGNPMFSSALYGADPAQVVEGLLRCANPQIGEEKWMWVPDPYLVNKYARMQPLKPYAGI